MIVLLCIMRSIPVGNRWRKLIESQEENGEKSIEKANWLLCFNLIYIPANPDVQVSVQRQV